MSSNASFLARAGRSGAIGAVLMAVGALSVGAGLARTTTSTPEGKVFVCKYVGTPGDNERLQTGQNPISVSINAIKDYAGPGSFFNDAHGRSYVLALDVGQPEPDVSECPSVPSTSTSSGASSTTTTSVDDPTSTTTTTAVDDPTTTTTIDDTTGTATTTTAVDDPTTTTAGNPTTTTSVDELTTTTTTTTVDEPTTTSTTPSAGNPTTTTSIDESTPTTAGLQTTTTQTETKGGIVTIGTTTPAVGPHTTTSTPAVRSQTETLPLTGGASVPLVAIGSLLFAAGAAMTIVAMRRRRAA